MRSEVIDGRSQVMSADAYSYKVKDHIKSAKLRRQETSVANVANVKRVMFCFVLFVFC